MKEPEPGDPYIAIRCVGILCRKICFSIPVELYQKLYDDEGELRPKYAGSNVCKLCRTWFENRVHIAKLLPERDHEDDGA